MASHARTSALLKVVTGSQKQHPERVRDEQVIKPTGPFVAPEIYQAFKPDEKIVYDWWVGRIKHFWLGDFDGATLAKMARMIAERERLQKIIDAEGIVVEDKQGKVISAAFRAALALDDRVLRLMSEMGLTPVSRLKFAPPLKDSAKSETWDNLT